MKKLITLIIAMAIVFSFASCGKKEIVGYDPEVPQEWKDAWEEEKNSPTTEVIRTTDFAGIWQNELTGEYYHMYNGEIYLIDRPDATEEEVQEWGIATIVQEVKKEVAHEYTSGGSHELVSGEEQDLYYESVLKTEAVEKIVVIDSDRTKVITESGREITFKFIQKVTDHPAGFETQYELDY